MPPMILRSIAPLVLACVTASSAAPAHARGHAVLEPVAGAEAGADDLTAAREQAAAGVAASPTPENLRAQAALAEQAGDDATARTAYEALEAALPKTDEAGRAAARRDRDRVIEHARGAVADEGASTQRERLDARWRTAARPAAHPPKARPDGPPPARRDDRIVRKWYFWVTLGAIAASAAAITGIAIKAARDDKPDALDRSTARPRGAAGGPAGAVLRF